MRWTQDLIASSWREIRQRGWLDGSNLLTTEGFKEAAKRLTVHELNTIETLYEEARYDLDDFRSPIQGSLARTALLYVKDGTLPAAHLDVFSDEMWSSWVRAAWHIYANFIDDPTWAPFVNALPSSAAAAVMARNTQYQGAFRYSESHRRYLIEHLGGDSTEAGRSAADWFVFHSEFLAKGGLEACLAKMHDGTLCSKLLLVIDSISKNRDPKEASGLVVDALKLARGKRLFENYIFDWILGIAFYRDRANPVIKKRLKAISDVRKYQDAKTYGGIWWAASVALNSDGLKSVAIDADFYGWYNGIAPQAMSFALTAMNFKLLDSPQCLGKIDLDAFLKSEPLFALEYFRLTGKKRAHQALAEAFGFEGLLSEYVEKPEWEMVLERLLTRESLRKRPKAATSEAADGPKARIVYVVCTNPPTLREIRVQKRKSAAGAWSKGLEGMTETDIAAAHAVKSFRPWPSARETLMLNEGEFFWALAGAQNVFDEASGDRVEIVKMPLQIEVKKISEGWWRFASSVDGCYSPEEGSIAYRGLPDGRIAVTRLSDEDAGLLGDVKDIAFPPEAENGLTDFLEMLSQSRTVMSPLLKNSKAFAKKAGSCVITLRLHPTNDDWYGAEALVHPVPGAELACEPGRGLADLAVSVKGAVEKVERHLKKEKDNFKALEARLQPLEPYRSGDFSWEVDTAGCLKLLEAVREGAEAGESVALEWPEGVKLSVSKAPIFADSLSLDIRRLGNWFEVEGSVKLDKKSSLSIAELLERIRAAESPEALGGFIRLSDKEYVALSESLKKQLARLDGFAQAGKAAASRCRLSTPSSLKTSRAKASRSTPTRASGAFLTALRPRSASRRRCPRACARNCAPIRSRALSGFRASRTGATGRFWPTTWA